jgi:hypothetical protein
LNWAEQALSNVFPDKMCPANLPSAWRIGTLKELYKLSCKSKGMQNFKLVVRAMKEVHKSKKAGGKATMQDVENAAKIYEKMIREGAQKGRERSVSVAIISPEQQQTSTTKGSKRKRSRVENSGALDETQEEDVGEAVPAPPQKKARKVTTGQAAITEREPSRVQRQAGTRPAQSRRGNNPSQATTATTSVAATSQSRRTGLSTAKPPQITLQQPSARQPPAQVSPMTATD